MEPLKFNLLNL